MNDKTGTNKLMNRQAILDEINGLLQNTGNIDETRAKKVRKAIEVLRTDGGAPATSNDDPAEDVHAEDIALDTRIDAALETLRARIHKQVERRDRDYEKALKLMDELETALRKNELQHAEKAYHKLMSIMGGIPGLSEQRWQRIEKRLNRVRPQIRKLESWRHWGTTQVRQNLINQVEQLTAAGLAPEKLAKRIQQARDQWHEWDRSGDHAGKELWNAFDQACEEAYKPCIDYFEKQKQRRAANLKKRQAIIDNLNARFASTDWKHPDWRELDRYVNYARRDFYKIGNVEFKQRKPVARAMNEALEQFEQYLSRERERSFRAREKLIADIEALAAVDRLRDAIDQLEVLKKQWTVTVAAKRKDENRLWKRFQAACDGIYHRRDAERKHQSAERESNLKQKQVLVEELKRAAKAEDDELLANTSALARIRDRWEHIGWVPRKQEASLDKLWRSAQKQFTGAVEAAQNRARASALDNIAKLAELCDQWEQATLAGETVDVEAAKAVWDALPKASGDIAEVMQQRFEQAFRRPNDEILIQNLAAKQQACLKLEVLLELESPDDCQAERMAYQIERLNASMHKDPDAQDTPEDLLHNALSTGAIPADAVETIRQRIDGCLAHYKSVN